jgi:hypothetical protein
MPPMIKVNYSTFSIPIVNQFNIFEFFLLLNIKLENFLITLISKMFTLYPNNFDLQLEIRESRIVHYVDHRWCCVSLLHFLV